MTHLSQSLVAFLAAQETSGSEFARTIGLSQATISRLSSGERPNLETLRALCTQWPDHKATLKLLVAHLRDEIDRAGRTQAEVEITSSTIDDSDDIHLLAREAKEDTDLAAILHDFAKMIRAHKARTTYPAFTEEQHLDVADDSASRALGSGAGAPASPATGQATPPAESAKYPKPKSR